MVLYSRNLLRCAVCLSQFDPAKLRGRHECPTCGTVIPPLKGSEDGFIKINWQDLRILATYAERWTDTFDLGRRGDRDALQALQNILRQLSGFRPPGALPLLPEHLIQKTILEFNPAASMTPDETGLIPSPYVRKGPK